jgi:hypothetical protein
VSPWAPIALTIAVSVLFGALVWRRSRDGLLVLAVVLLVLAVASAALGSIATVAFFWAASLVVLSAAALFASWLRARSDRT